MSLENKKVKFSNIDEIKEFLDQKLGLENVPENILDDINKSFESDHPIIFSLEKILEYSNFFRSRNISSDTFTSFFNQKGSSWRSKLTRGNWYWDKQAQCYKKQNQVEESKIKEAKDNDQTDQNQSRSEVENVFTNVNLCINDTATEINDLKEKVSRLENVINNSFKIDDKKQVYFEVTHLEKFQNIPVPQREEFLTDIEYVESTRVRAVCVHLFRRAADKVGYTRKNIISELFYRFSEEILSPEEIDDVLISEFQITDLSYKNDKNSKGDSTNNNKS